jgi:hypothetical protein
MRPQYGPCVADPVPGLADTRLLLNEQARGRFLAVLVVLVFWLTFLFVGFGSLATQCDGHRHAFAGAISVAGAIFLILEMNRPYSGLMQISMAPVRNALTRWANSTSDAPSGDVSTPSVARSAPAAFVEGHQRVTEIPQKNRRDDHRGGDSEQSIRCCAGQPVVDRVHHVIDRADTAYRTTPLRCSRSNRVRKAITARTPGESREQHRSLHTPPPAHARPQRTR